MFGPPFFFDFFTAMRFADPPYIFQDAELENPCKNLRGRVSSINTTPLLNSSIHCRVQTIGHEQLASASIFSLQNQAMTGLSNTLRSTVCQTQVGLNRHERFNGYQWTLVNYDTTSSVGELCQWLHTAFALCFARRCIPASRLALCCHLNPIL